MKNQEVENLVIALRMCEYDVTYIQADLMIRVHNELKKKQGSFTVMDAKKILHEWKQDHNVPEKTNPIGWQSYVATQCGVCSYLQESGQTNKCTMCRIKEDDFKKFIQEYPC